MTIWQQRTAKSSCSRQFPMFVDRQSCVVVIISMFWGRFWQNMAEPWERKKGGNFGILEVVIWLHRE